MREPQLFQSSSRRAVADTLHTPRQNPWFFWSVGIVMVALGGFLGTIYTPEGSGKFLSVICPTAGVILGAIIVIIIVFIINLILAPYRQRNEARALLAVKPKPIPLPNRDALIRAISRFKECALVHFINRQVINEARVDNPSCAQCSLGDGSYDFIQAYQVLSDEMLVAGEKVKNIVSQLAVFVFQQILEQDNDQSSSIVNPNSDEFISELNKKVENTIKRINTLIR